MCGTQLFDFIVYKNQISILLTHNHVDFPQI